MKKLFTLLVVFVLSIATAAEQTIILKAYPPESGKVMHSLNPNTVTDPHSIKEVMVPTEAFIKSFDKCWIVNKEGQWEEVVTKDYIASLAVLEKSGPVVYYIVHNGITYWDRDPSDLPKNAQFKKDTNWDDFRYAYPLAYVWDGKSKLTKPKYKPMDISQVK